MNRAGIAVAAAAVAMLAYSASHLSWRSDVTRFMPSGEDQALAELSRALADSELARTMILSVGAARLEDALAALAELAESLREHPQVASLRIGFDTAEFEPLFELYFPRRHLFLSGVPDDPEHGVAARLSDEALRARARELRAELALPASPLLERLAARDPLGAFRSILERFRGTERELELRDGRFVSRDGETAIALLETRDSPFDTAHQAPLLRAIEESFAGVARSRGDPSLFLEQSGVHRFAVRIEASIQRDGIVVMSVGIAGVALLFLAFFRSVAVLGLAGLPVLLGILGAMTLGVASRGDVDALTLAFGACLIGVAIDYPIHLLNHHALVGGGKPASASARHLRPSLLLGAGTTMASFTGLLLTSFPGFREIGSFAITGVALAVVATLVALPRLVGGGRPIPERSRRIAHALGVSLERLRRHRRAIVVVPVATLVLAALALPRLEWQDDLSGLSSLDPQLLEEDGRVRARVSQFDASRFVLVLAPDEEDALAANDAVHARLARLSEEGAIEGMRSLHALLFAPSLQRRNWELVSAQPDLYERIDTAFRAEGFRPGAFAPLKRELALGPPPLLELAELRASPLGELVSSLAVPLEDSVAVVTYLRGVRSEARVREALRDVPEARLFDQSAFLDEIYASFRNKTLEQIAIGSVLVMAVLWLRYRRLRPTLAASAPSLLMAVLVLSIFALAGVRVNLLHVVSLILVMGMGVDYGIFLVDGARSHASAGATMLSLLLSCLTTLFVFGTLSLSSHDALRAMGLTTGAGILLCFALAPLSLVLLGEQERP